MVRLQENGLNAGLFDTLLDRRRSRPKNNLEYKAPRGSQYIVPPKRPAVVSDETIMDEVLNENVEQQETNPPPPRTPNKRTIPAAADREFPYGQWILLVSLLLLGAYWMTRRKATSHKTASREISIDAVVAALGDDDEPKPARKKATKRQPNKPKKQPQPPTPKPTKTVSNGTTTTPKQPTSIEESDAALARQLQMEDEPAQEQPEWEEVKKKKKQ